MNQSPPSPRRVIVVGRLDVEDLPSYQIRLWLGDRSIIGFFPQEPNRVDILALQDKEVRIAGMAYFQPNGRLAYVFIDHVGEPVDGDAMFRRISSVETISQQIDQHKAHGKLANPLEALRGTWPGEERLEDLLILLRR